MKQELTKEEAIRLHRKMWSDMQKDLGNCPSVGARIDYKMDWCIDHFPDQSINNCCFLCEWVAQQKTDCRSCPIIWGNAPSCCAGGGNVHYDTFPISDILALPERKEVIT